MNSFTNRIFCADSLAELTSILESEKDITHVREILYSRFMECANYSTPSQWNRAVRLCECLAITGWGEHEGVEAHAGQYVNGYPNTYFTTAGGETRYLDAVWHRRNGGTAIDPGRSVLKYMPGQVIESVVCYPEKLLSQRNWLPKCPVRIVRTLDNCYSGSRAVLDSIDNDLNPRLMQRMRPELYGIALNRIYINCAMSFYDDYHCKTNYVIADENAKLRKSEYHSALLAMRSPEEIEREGLYLRPRYDIGPFRKDTGLVYATIVFEKAFSMQPAALQKRQMSEYFLSAAQRIASRQRKLDYDFNLMIDDLERVLEWWTGLN